MTWVLLSLLGGWIAADGTSVGQIMVSRPLIAATLAGWLVGDPAAGATVGIVLEVFNLTVLPVGAARYPEGGPPAVVAGALFALSDQRPGTILTAVVFFLVWEAVAGASIRGMRQVNGRIVRAGGITGEAELERRHLAAIGLDITRGVLLVAIGIPILAAMIALTSGVATALDDVSALALRLAVIALLASAVRLFGRRVRFVAAGAVAGLLVLLLRS